MGGKQSTLIKNATAHVCGPGRLPTKPDRTSSRHRNDLVSFLALVIPQFKSLHFDRRRFQRSHRQAEKSPPSPRVGRKMFVFLSFFTSQGVVKAVWS